MSCTEDFFIHLKGYSGVALHLCCDVQGWVPPDDLDRRLVTRANKIQKYSSETQLEFEKHAIATVYGKGETFTFGGVGSLQFSVYNKSKLISKNQNVQEYWHTVYSARCFVEGQFDDSIPFSDGETVESLYRPVFKKDVDVYRLEARFHHSVIAQFALAMNEDFRCFKDMAKHLTGIWRYALRNFRLDSSPTYIDCVWQFLRDDVEFNHDRNALEYKRIYKKTDFDSPPSDRVLKIVFGLLCSCYRRLKYDIDKAFQCLQDSGVYDALEALYIRLNDWDIEYTWLDAREHIRQALELKLFPPMPISCD